MADTWDELRATDNGGGFSPTYPEYAANAWIHTTATVPSAAHAQGTSYAAWVAAPEHRARFRHDAEARKPRRCMFPFEPCSCDDDALDASEAA